MAILQANNLYMGFSGDTLFRDITFSIDEKDKIGIIGLNGSGKTTLIKILLDLEYSEVNPATNERGTVSKKSNLKIGYLSQNPNFDKDKTVFEEMISVYNYILEDYSKIQELNNKLVISTEDTESILEELGKLIERYEQNEGYSIEYKIKQILIGINLDESLWNMKISKLSGGQLSRVALGKILLIEPDLLILDEPTNHLDLNSIEWLEKVLKDYNKAILLISHDVYFLDNVVNRVFEIEKKTLTTYRGNYTDFVIQKEAYLSGAVKAYEKEQEKILKMEEYIRKYKAGIKSKQARGREKLLSRMDKMENPVVTTKKMKLKFDSSIQSVDLVLNIENLSKRFEDKELFKNINMKIYRSDRVGIIGKNGTGKSTLLKIINGLEKSSSGTFKIGEKVKIGYFDQNHQKLGLNNNIIEELTFHHDILEPEARNMCGAFLFREDDIYKKISQLSGGEKARVSFMKLILEKPNFLILDEPTNHLDIYSREVLTDALESYPGTILVVSHDRNFLDNIVNKIYEITTDGVNLFDGDYKKYLETKSNIKIKNEDSIKQYELQKRNKSKLSSLEKKIARIEKEINNLEEKKEEKNNLYTLAGEKNNLDELLIIQEEINKIDSEITEKLEEWENLEKELEELNN